MKDLTTTYDTAGLPTSASDAATGESLTYTHDAVGNLKQIDSSIASNDWTFTYDPYSRLTCAVQGSTCASGAGRVLFTLDALDRALSRAKDAATTSFTYRGSVETVVQSSGSSTTTYAYTAGGDPMAEKTGTIASFYLRDLHGDVVGLASTVAANQGTSSFDPWGRSLISTGQTSFLGYQGDMTDPDTKQVDMGTRWYAAGLGRFSSRDVLLGELESPMTLNQHVYAGMNPITMWDPTGMGACTMPGECVTTTTSGGTQAVGGNPGAADHPYHEEASSVTTTPRRPAPEPRRSSGGTRAFVDVASAALNGIAVADRWRLNEARDIFRAAGQGFLRGPAVESWIARSDILRRSALSRAGRLGVGAGSAAFAAAGAWLRYDELRAEGYSEGEAVAGSVLSVGVGVTTTVVVGAICSTGIGCLILGAGAGLLTTGVADAIFESAFGGRACGPRGFKAPVPQPPPC